MGNRRKMIALVLAGVMALGAAAGATPALAADGDTASYTLNIPSTLTVANSGWNATDGISATGTLASGKKLTVTASSANSWALKQQDGSETVGYTMKETLDGAAKNAWEFTTLPGSATLGIDVADYSTKPAGTYKDTVTFTAKVENAVTTVTWNNDDITGTWEPSFTKDGVTITAGMIDFHDKNFMDGGTFTTTLGNFTKIEVSSADCYFSGTGWSGSSSKKTWTGKASSVSFSGDIMGMGQGNTKFVFTIEPTN